MAEKGVFNRHDMTPMDSAKNTPLFEALTYLSLIKAEQLDAT